MKKYFLYLFLASSLVACKDVSEVCVDTNYTYNDEIKTIIDNNCSTSGCHSQGAYIGDYTTYDGMKSIFDGEFEDRVIDKGNMPKGFTLNFGDKSKLECWMENGFAE
ncbi:MAG: hypothetical protein ACI8ZX_000572 [Planctomycetota bacterium]|jgi:hypothetical protein